MTASLSHPIVWEDETLVSAGFDDEDDDDYDDEETEEDLDSEFDEDLDDEEDEGFDEVDEEEYEMFEDEELYDENDGPGSHRRRRGDWE